MITKKINLENSQEAVQLLGEQDTLMKQMELDFGVELFLRQDASSNQLILSIKGSRVRAEKAMRRIREKLDNLRRTAHRDEGRVQSQEQGAVDPSHPYDSDILHLPPDAIYRSSYGRLIRPQTERQRQYVQAILTHELVFGIGPAGTGKTFLAVACALRALQAREVHRVILTRPVIEAGEKLGFLPGDLLEKVHPYLKPLYDAFHVLLGPQRFKMWHETDVIEVVPLAYMRGRTFDDAFIILDEAQNTTPEQMKMFLTRMGGGSRIVVTGDVTQSDLAEQTVSGLVRVLDILKGVEGVAFQTLTEEDVIRHPLVKKIIKAYERWQGKK